MLVRSTTSALALAVAALGVTPARAADHAASVATATDATTTAAAADATDADASAVDATGDATAASDDLLNLSLEELLAREVTSVAKKSRRIGDSAAAVTVITQEDIRESSARTIPDLLRMVPGMEIAEVQSSATSVSARGFTSRFAANLLVMVDGAAIYSTSISGMFWDQALVPLQDIERIEVIRGPGGALWGSNSMNGIVNIITKQAVDTQGLRLNASLGTFAMRGEAGFGRQLSDDLGFRIYGDYRKTDGLDGPNGGVPGNEWQGGLGGIRFDYAPTKADSAVLLAEYSEGKFDERFVNVSLNPLAPGARIDIQNNRFHAKHVLARWKRQFSDDFDATVQGYFNNLRRTEFGAAIDRDLYDLSLEGRWRANARHEFNFGIAGRISHDRVGNTTSLSLPAGSSTDRWLTGYIQDDVSLVPDRVILTLGSKFEQNNFTGTEIQPSVRLLYRVDENFAAWGAVSRAVRTPLLVQRKMIANVALVRDVPGFPMPIPVNATFYGSLDAQAEEATAYEIGFRGNLADGWSYDVAAFYTDYNQLVTADRLGQRPIIVPPIPFPVGVQADHNVGNAGVGKSKGVEMLIAGTVAPWWKVEASYSYLDLDVKTVPSSYILAGTGTSPNHQWRFESNMDLTPNLSLDTFLHYVGETANEERPAYTDLDIRMTYHLNSRIEVSAVGNNLLKKRRLEYYHDSLPIELSYVPRTAFVEARLRF